jgi:hypothetical protein
MPPQQREAEHGISSPRRVACLYLLPASVVPEPLPMRRPHVFGDVIAMIDGWYGLSRELERFG